MIIGKYDIAKGSGTNSSPGATAVAGGSGTAVVDLTPITTKIAALESKVSYLELQLGLINAALRGLDGRFLSKFGDRSEYSYALGSLYTDFIQSEMFDNGVGFRVSGNATGAVEDKYNLIVKDVGWAQIPFNSVLQDSASFVDHNTDEATAQLNVSNVSIGATNASGFVLVDCGVQLTNERCFTTISKRVMYTVRAREGQAIHVDPEKEAQTDSNGNFILLFQKADNISIDIRFMWTYSFRQYGNISSGTFRLYVQGTDPSHNKTDCFAVSIKTTRVNASGVTIMEGDNGTRITSGGMQHTTDGGTTWS